MQQTLIKRSYDEIFCSWQSMAAAGFWIVCLCYNLLATFVMMYVYGWWMSCSQPGFKGILPAVIDCRWSSLIFVLLAFFSPLFTSSAAAGFLLFPLFAGFFDQKIKGAILKMSICVFFFFFLFYDPRWEHLHTVSAVMQTVCVSLISRHIRCIVKIKTSARFLLFCQGLTPLTDDVNISHSSVSFHILNCLSVIRGEKGRVGETSWPSPLLFYTSHSAY